MVKYKQSEVPEFGGPGVVWPTVERREGGEATSNEALWCRQQLDKRYQPLSFIGRGRFGRLIAAQDKGTGHLVALKQILRKFQTEDNTTREYRLLSCLAHKNIIRALAIFHSAPQQDADTIVLEMVDGIHVLDFLCTIESHELTLKNLIKQLVYAIQYLHSQHIAHRDIKPENIMVENGGVLKLIDFGSASSSSNNDHPGPQCPFDLEFSSPELITCSESASTQTDLWSTGVFLYVCLSGVSPFLDDSEEETSSNVLHSDYSFPAEYFSSVPDSARQLVSSLLVLDPASRALPHSLLLSPWFKESEVDAEIPKVQLLNFVNRRNPFCLL